MTIYKIDPEENDVLGMVASDGEIDDAKIGEDGRIWIKTSRSRDTATERSDDSTQTEGK